MKKFLWIYFLSLTVFCGGYLIGSIHEASLVGNIYEASSGFPSIMWWIMGILTVVGAVGTLITVIAAGIWNNERDR